MKKHWCKITLVLVVMFIVAYWLSLRLEAQENPVALIDHPLYNHSPWSKTILNRWGVNYIAYEQGIALELRRAVDEGRRVLIVPAMLDSFGEFGDCHPLQQNLVMVEAVKYAHERGATVYIGNNDCQLLNPYVVRVGALDNEGNKFGGEADIWLNGCEFTCTFSEAILRASTIQR